MEVSFRDMYKRGTETVILSGRAAEWFATASISERCDYLSRLETVTFTHIYDVTIRHTR